MIVKVIIAAPDERKTHLAEDTETIKEILQSNEVRYERATLMLDGMILGATDINRALSEFHPQNECILSVTIKLDNAG